MTAPTPERWLLATQTAGGPAGGAGYSAAPPVETALVPAAPAPPGAGPGGAAAMAGTVGPAVPGAPDAAGASFAEPPLAAETSGAGLIGDLLAACGTGLPPGPDVVDLGLRAAETVVRSAPRIAGVLAENWDASSADGALTLLAGAGTAGGRVAAGNAELQAAAAEALEITTRCHAELCGIASAATAELVAAAPAALAPGGPLVLAGIAARHVESALAVVGRAQVELEAPTATAARVAADAVPLPPRPHPGALLASAGGVARGTPGSEVRTLPASHLFTGPPLARPDSPDDGVAVTLPDGSTAFAPNERAATAVRSALTAVGTPYVWGGNSPGAGLDCSGLTTWAYGQAGVELPRLAQSQHLGNPQVPADELMPGDLAVWDGHVALVVGNGMMVEAGDPVQVNPVRTDNIGMGFYGFYRPT